MVCFTLRTPSGHSIAVARAKHTDGVHIGFLCLDGGELGKRGVIFSWGGKEVDVEEGEVLVIE
jgi:hypothetical protein